MNISWTQDAITLASGACGVGIAYGLLKSRIRDLSSRMEKVETKQSVLRGEDKGGMPLYMTRITCGQIRNECHALALISDSRLEKELSEHTNSIRGLENFARWFMQEKGLTITEINKILNADKT